MRAAAAPVARHKRAEDNSASDMNEMAQPEVRSPIHPDIAGGSVNRFQALRDSARTHSVLLRFGTVSLTTAILDNLTFYLVFHATGTIAGAQVAARTVSVFLNYGFVRRFVFSSRHGHHILFPRYLLLVAVNALLSYAGIRLLSATTPLGVMQSKIVAETLLFAMNFIVQRALVFKRPA